MTSLSEELAPSSGCRVCSFLAALPAREAAEWRGELGKPVNQVGNTSVVRALAKRGVILNEASVRRHRVNHAG